MFEAFITSECNLFWICKIKTIKLLPHFHCLLCLLWQGKADLEVRNNRQQTPLLLAVSQGHVPLIELLVMRGKLM